MVRPKDLAVLSSPTIQLLVSGALPVCDGELGALSRLLSSPAPFRVLEGKERTDDLAFLAKFTTVLEVFNKLFASLELPRTLPLPVRSSFGGRGGVLLLTSGLSPLSFLSSTEFAI